MATHLHGQFETRRMAEIAVERLVQEYSVKRNDITVAPIGAENTAGLKTMRDAESEAALNGRVLVSALIEQEDLAVHILQALPDFKPSERK